MTAGRLVFPALRWREETGFAHEATVIDQALEGGAGGFILFGGTAEAVAALTARLEREAGRPLLIGSDLERGAGQQVEGLSELPPPRALASLGDDEVIEMAGRLTAADALSVGINWVYAPVGDLDVDPENPIVQTRSFGDDPARVSYAVTRWIAGCQGAGALACVKHFPGHGRTRHDSHDRLPVVDVALDVLERTDLAPFRAAVKAGVRSVMTAHVSYPALDPEGGPATRSRAILSRLRQSWGFDGLVVTDALIMEGARGGLSAEHAAVEAVRASVDCLLYPPDPTATRAELARAARSDAVLAESIERAVVRIDAALAWIAALRASPASARPVDRSLPPGRTASRSVADRVLARLAPQAVSLRAPLELAIVDDDLDGAYPPGPSDWTARALAARGVGLGTGGSRVVLAFAEPRASKGRAGFGAASRERLSELVPGADLVVLFAHERLLPSLPPGPPRLGAWHRQRLMQEAVADWIVERIG